MEKLGKTIRVYSGRTIITILTAELLDLQSYIFKERINNVF